MRSKEDLRVLAERAANNAGLSYSSASFSPVEVSFERTPDGVEYAGVDYGGGYTDGHLALGSLSSGDRAELRRQLDQGMIFGIRFKVRSFNDAENMNFARPTPDETEKMVGQEIIYATDHIPGNKKGNGRLSDKDGTWLNSEVEVFDRGEMKYLLTDPKPQFSMGFRYKGISCSICGEEYEKRPSFFGMSLLAPGCKHRRGEQYDGQTCEAFLHTCSAKELSRVPIGAVEGTGVLSLSLGEYQEVLSMAATQGVEPQVAAPAGAAENDFEALYEAEKAAKVALEVELSELNAERADLVNKYAEKAMEVLVFEGKARAGDVERVRAGVEEFGLRFLELELAQRTDRIVEPVVERIAASSPPPNAEPEVSGKPSGTTLIGLFKERNLTMKKGAK